jgi:hypothetical protein
MVLDGPMTGEAFRAYVEQVLVPELAAVIRLKCVTTIKAKQSKESAMQTHQADYFGAYRTMKMTRDAKGATG